MISTLKSKLCNKQNILIGVILLLITFFICMLSPLDIFSFNGGTATDSSVFKYIGSVMSDGQIPYVDTFDHKGLLIYFINYFGFLISPHRGVWLFEFLFMFLSVVFTYKIATKFVNKKYAILAVLITMAPIYSYFEGGNLTEEYALPFQIISLYIFLDFFLNSYKYMSDKNALQYKCNFKLFNFKVFVCGLCFAGVLFLRPNMISVWAVFAIMVLIYSILNKKYIEIFKFFLSFVLGILVIFIPMFSYLLMNDALEGFIGEYILFNMNYSAYNDVSDVINSFQFFFNSVFVWMSIIIIIIKIYYQFKRKESTFFNVGYLIYMLITLFVVSMSGYQFLHYGMTLIPMFIYPFSLVLNYISNLENHDLKLIAFVFLIMTFVISNWSNMILESFSEMINKYSDSYNNVMIDYIKKHTEQEELITVVGNNDIIYNFSERESASKYSYQLPLIFMSDEIYDDYFNDITVNKPKMIVNCLDLNQYPGFKKDLNRFINQNNYELVLEAECDLYER